jgi:hypothetical protein
VLKCYVIAKFGFCTVYIFALVLSSLVCFVGASFCLFVLNATQCYFSPRVNILHIIYNASRLKLWFFILSLLDSQSVVRMRSV